MSNFDELLDSVAEQELQDSIRPEDHYAHTDPNKTYPHQIRRWTGDLVWECGIDGACIHTTEAYAVAHKADTDRRKALPELVRVTATYEYDPRLSNYPEGTTSAYAAMEVDKAQCEDTYDVLALMEGAYGNDDPRLKVEWSTVSRWDKDR